MKKATTRALIPLVIFIALAALLFYGLHQDPRLVPSPLVDKDAPAFELESLPDANRHLTREILLGKVSLVNVWASWCPSCREEHGELMRIAQDNPDLQIVGFNWKDQRAAGLQMLQQFGNPYSLILYDPDNQAGIDWGVYGAPETFVVDAEGIIRYKQVGPITAEVWARTLKPIVDKYRPGKS